MFISNLNFSKSFRIRDSMLLIGKYIFLFLACLFHCSFPYDVLPFKALRVLPFPLFFFLKWTSFTVLGVERLVILPVSKLKNENLNKERKKFIILSAGSMNQV